ncbi:MAG: permease prefix domain 1-containing protein [Oscillibacter sp.]
MRFQQWCDAALRYIRFRPDREAVGRELLAHLEDHCAELEEIGYDHDTAAERALTAMGNPETVGRAMDRVHTPLLGWLWMLSKCLLGFCGFCAIFMLLNGGWRMIFDDLQPVAAPEDYEENGPMFLSPAAVLADGEIYERIALGTASESVERCGTKLEVSYAALWRSSTNGADEVYWMSLILTARDRRFWDGGPDIIAMTLDTDSGLHYASDYAGWGNSEHYYLRASRQKPFCATYEISSCLHEFPTEWVELGYSYGEPWSIRVDWEAVT